MEIEHGAFQTAACGCCLVRKKGERKLRFDCFMKGEITVRTEFVKKKCIISIGNAEVNHVHGTPVSLLLQSHDVFIEHYIK